MHLRLSNALFHCHSFFHRINLHVPLSHCKSTPVDPRIPRPVITVHVNIFNLIIKLSNAPPRTRFKVVHSLLVRFPVSVKQGFSFSKRILNSTSVYAPSLVQCTFSSIITNLVWIGTGCTYSCGMLRAPLFRSIVF